jgi:hypothetical protein
LRNLLQSLVAGKSDCIDSGSDCSRVGSSGERVFDGEDVGDRGGKVVDFGEGEAAREIEGDERTVGL